MGRLPRYVRPLCKPARWQKRQNRRRKTVVRMVELREKDPGTVRDAAINVCEIHEETAGGQKLRQAGAAYSPSLVCTQPRCPKVEPARLQSRSSDLKPSSDRKSARQRRGETGRRNHEGVHDPTVGRRVIDPAKSC